MTPTLNQEKPDIVVIHVGSHHIDFRQLRYNAVENIGKDIINITQRCRQSGFWEVIMSSILVKSISLQNVLGS